MWVQYREDSGLGHKMLISAISDATEKEQPTSHQESNYTVRCFVSFRYGMICNVHMTCLIGAHLSKPGTLRRELWERAYTLWILMAPTHVFARPIIWARRSNTPCRRSWPAAANSSGITYLPIPPITAFRISVYLPYLSQWCYKSTSPCPIFPVRDS